MKIKLHVTVLFFPLSSLAKEDEVICGFGFEVSPLRSAVLIGTDLLTLRRGIAN
jgi:hypothetical protein